MKHIAPVMFLALLLPYSIAALPCVGRDPSAVSMKVATQFALGGVGIENQTAAFVAADLDGDGAMEWVLANGTKWAKAYDTNGSPMWSRTYPGPANADNFMCSAITAWDLDGDGREEPIVFTQKSASGYAFLSVLDPATGATKADAQLWWHPTYANRPAIAVIVGRGPTSPPAIWVCYDNPTSSHFRAYEYRAGQSSLSLLFEKPTLSVGDKNQQSGHSMFPYDANSDGVHDVVFYGTFAVNPTNGNRLWRMSNFAWSDHADGLVAADIDPTSAGSEVAAVGMGGTSCYRVSDGTLLWKVPTSTIADPQNIMVLEADCSKPGLEVLVKERSSTANRRSFLLSSKGAVIWSKNDGEIPEMQVDLDGNRSEDEVFTAGMSQVRSPFDVLLGGNSWFWNLASDPAYWNRWKFNAFAQDVLGDSREEIIVYGQTKFIVGTNQKALANPPGSFRDDPTYLLSRRTKNRAATYFDFRGTAGEPPPPPPPPVVVCPYCGRELDPASICP